jgi:hypothetical protein
MLINGKCHCGNMRYVLQWDGGATQIPARACGCTFCIKHGGVWTSDPRASLTVAIVDGGAVSRYAFGTRTATFHVCSRCGTVPVATSEIAGRLYAVVNVNAMEDVDPASVLRAHANFDGEDVATRLARRARNWIPDVRFVSASGDVDRGA